MTTTTAMEIEPRYYVKTKSDCFPHGSRWYRGVSIMWFVRDRDDCPIPGVYEETMPRQEADAVVAYMADKHDETCELVPMHTEVGDDMGYMPYGHNPVGGGADFFRLCDEPGYELPFKLWGFYVIDNAEEVTQAVNATKLVKHVASELGLSVPDNEIERVGGELQDSGFKVCAGRTAAEEAELRDKREEERERMVKAHDARREQASSKCAAILEMLPGLTGLSIDGHDFVLSDGVLTDRSEDIPF